MYMYYGEIKYIDKYSFTLQMHTHRRVRAYSSAKLCIGGRQRRPELFQKKKRKKKKMNENEIK